MIWATVSCQYCFWWLYRASPSAAAKNIIKLCLVLAIWWCSYVEPSLILLGMGVCYDQCVTLQNSASLCKTLLAFAKLDFILYFKAKIACYSRYLLTSYFCISAPWWKGLFFFFLVLKYLVGLHKSFNFNFFGTSGWGINFDYCDIEWFALIILSLLRFYPSSAFQTLFLNYDIYSNSSKGFLPTVVGITIIWIKFPHSIPF